ncbi:hypothetical protein BC567DRAFT_61251 [Phyllosticta citribraziliensis]
MSCTALRCAALRCADAAAWVRSFGVSRIGRVLRVLLRGKAPAGVFIQTGVSGNGRKEARKKEKRLPSALRIGTEKEAMLAGLLFLFSPHLRRRPGGRGAFFARPITDTTEPNRSPRSHVCAVQRRPRRRAVPWTPACVRGWGECIFRPASQPAPTAPLTCSVELSAAGLG